MEKFSTETTTAGREVKIPEKLDLQQPCDETRWNQELRKLQSKIRVSNSGR